MNVQDLMTTRVATVQPNDTLERATRAMEDRSCGCLPVVDAEDHILGIVTDRDVCLAALRANRALSNVKVESAMTRPAFVCRPADSIAEAERLMGQHQVRRLPVADDGGRLVGLLALDDIAREAWHEGGWIAAPVSTEAVGMTLGQIARPQLIETSSAGVRRRPSPRR